MGNWLIQLAINYLLTQLAKVGTAVNWGTLKTEANGYVNAFVPAFLQSSVDGVVDGAIDAVAAACQDTGDLQLLVADLQAQNWTKALTDLNALLLKSVHPQAGAVAAVAAPVAA